LPKKTNQPKREMTRRQLSHHQRESRIQRFVLILGAAVVVIVVAVVGWGIYQSKFRPFQQTVFKVGSTEYSMDYYINMLAYYGGVTGNPQNIPYLTSQVEQVIEQNKIILDEAAKLGFTVTNAEVNQKIKDLNIGSDAARKDAVRTSLVLDELKSGYFDKQVPQSGPQRDVLAMFLESQAEADAIVANQLDLGADFSQVASDNSLETNSKDKKGDFGWVPKGILSSLLNSTVLEDKVFAADTPVGSYVTVEDPAQSKSLGYWLVKATETQTSSADSSIQKHVFAMLLPDLNKAQEIKKQLDAGADFVELAKANSQYVSAADNGGDLNFLSKGALGDAVDAVLFPDDASKALPLNTVSDPIKDVNRLSNGGVWLFKITAADDNKAIEGDNRTTLINNALNDWISQIWSNDQSEIQSFITSDQTNFAITEALKR
jgi:parvulin-like peptidyl-prolyl isomerase